VGGLHGRPGLTRPGLQGGLEVGPHQRSALSHRRGNGFHPGGLPAIDRVGGVDGGHLLGDGFDDLLGSGDGLLFLVAERPVLALFLGSSGGGG